MKEKIKKNLPGIISFIIGMLLFIVPLPYYIEKDGGLISTKDRIQIENAYIATGSFHMAYVSELKVNIPIYIVSLFHNDWDLIPKKEVVLEKETEEDVYFRSKLLLDESMDYAVIAAYNLANKDIVIEKEECFVTYIDSLANTTLQVQDKILKVNGKTITSKEDIYEAISHLRAEDKVIIEVERDGKIVEKEATLFEYNNNILMGIMVTAKRTITTSPSIKFSFEKSESGSSGGLMMALQIYNELTEEDITNGLKIAGTGTIDNMGNVGEISGVKYKIKGASKDGADIFFVPNGANYEEAIKTKEEYNLSIKVIGVSTLQEAIQKLKEG